MHCKRIIAAAAMLAAVTMGAHAASKEMVFLSSEEITGRVLRKQTCPTHKRTAGPRPALRPLIQGKGNHKGYPYGHTIM